MTQGGWRLSALWRLSRSAMHDLAADQPRRFHLLDGVRALAAVAILIYHYQHFFIPIGGLRPVGAFARGPLETVLGDLVWRGYLAVPVFWMISGFVFSRAYLPAPTGAATFTRNRLARLYPLHLLTLVAVAALQVLCIARFGESQIYRNTDLYHFALHLAFASNWGFESGYAFNAPIWSVSVEILIYAAFWLCHRRLFSFGVVLPLLVAAAFGALLWHFPQNRIAQCGYFFFVGAALYLIYSPVRQTGWPLAVLALAMIAGAVPILAWSDPGLLKYLGVPLVFGGLLLLLAIAETRVPKRAHRPLGALGDSSYGLYLWHIPVQLGLFLAFGAGLARAAESWAFLAGYLAIVIAIAWAGFVGYERPMQRWLRGRSAKARPHAAAP
ncbi:MAG: hypothetical protein B7Z08_02765 [Sphingomonadales bacterium 32-68-7]|nr:MAG: hypothetical protein B7Z33_13210 [Sphingomonadales bacterium 12-68-11]OYX09971.1 MAG: hypothetical protein B7Z08_02765 [Sphingomonadales bacterium 32-68-7]